MDYSNDPNPNQHPNAHDYDQLSSIYSHTDSTNSPSLTVDATADDVDAEESPARRGEVIRESSDGHATELVRPDGKGGFVLTHVLWARTPI